MSVFVDSNVLVYVVDRDEASKRAVAARLVAEHAFAVRLVTSTQVLQETFHVLTRKKRIPAADALEFVATFARRRVVPSNAEFVRRALSLSIAARLSVWDALIVQAALDGGCTTLYSEDLQHGRRFGALEVVNPFIAAAHEPLSGKTPSR
jgi:predicted nucleic acid-binding protein